MKPFRTDAGTGSILFLVFVAMSPMAGAAELRAARVTKIINDVKLLPGQAAARAATVNEELGTGTAVRTGVESRTELTFSDLTITRLGANTIFSFNEGARQIELGGGAVLVQVPRGGAEAKVATAAVTAAITGGTALFESNKGFPTKLLMLEGIGRFYPNGHPEEAEIVHGGEMAMRTADGRITQPTKFNAALVYKTSKLITSFSTLPNADLILAVIEQQQAEISQGPSNPPPSDPIDKTSQAVVAAPPAAAVSSKFGPLTTITSPDPYVIGSGTAINTDPTITTNAVTDQGKIYRGPAQDGSPSDYLFGSTTSFDTMVFDHPANGVPVAVFKFSDLQLTGDPTISIPSGATTFLGLVSVGDITSGAPGGTLTFAGITRLFIATQNGSINLGSDIAFSGIPHFDFYARGAGSNLTLASPISGADVVNVNAEGTVQINGDITASSDFTSFSGGDYLSGTGTITAFNIDVESLSNINIDSSKFPNPPGGGGSFILNAANTLNLAINGGGVFGWDTLTAQANTINLTSPGPTTFDFSNSTSVSFTAGFGGIQASNIDFVLGGGLSLLSGAGINVRSVGGGVVDAIISAATSFTASGDVVATTLTTGTTVDVGGALAVDDTLTAGGNINVGGFFLAVNVNAPSGILNVQGGIVPFADEAIGASLQHTFNVDSIVSPAGIDFNGNRFNGINGLSSGGRLTINATTLTFDSATGVASANFNGADANAFGSGSPHDGGDGGIFVVNTTGNITANNGANITATTGVNSDIGVFSGAGGSVTLKSSGGIVTVNDTIQVSSDDSPAQRRSASGGTILLQSNLTTGPGITVGPNAQLLSLLSTTAPGPGGSITLSTMGANITVSPGAVIQADQGTITMDQMDPPNQVPIISIEGATLSSQALRITAAGDLDIGMNSPVTINAGSVSLSVAHDLNLGAITLSGLAGDLIGNASIASGQISHATNGGVLDINANSLSIGAGIFASVTLNGADASSTFGPGDGGTFNVNTTGDITANNGANITATTGLNSAAGVFNGAGGSVALQSSGGTVTVNDTIQVSSDDSPAQRQSASGGDINITSGKTTGVAINVSSSAQLLALLDAAAPGPGGKITIMATTATGNNSSINVNGTVQADRGTVDIEHAGDNGQINLTNADVRADIVKVGVFGSNGTLNIGGGTLSADTTLKLYAPGSSGTINFLADVTLSGASAKIIAGDTVNIFNTVIVTIGGVNPASVFTNHPNYTGFGGNGSRTGTFAGAGATNPQPLSTAPPFGP